MLLRSLVSSINLHWAVATRLKAWLLRLKQWQVNMVRHIAETKQSSLASFCVDYW